MSELTSLTAYIDGACSGNPGPAAIGIAITDASGRIVKPIGEPIGVGTSNIAEYRALIRALAEAKLLGADEILVLSDSELLVRISRMMQTSSPERFLPSLSKKSNATTGIHLKR